VNLTREILGFQYAAWKEQRKSVELFQRKFVPEAKQYAEATMTAYQNVTSNINEKNK